MYITELSATADGHWGHLDQNLMAQICTYSMFSIISTGSIKRTGFQNLQSSLLNVPYDLKIGHEQINILVSIKRTCIIKHSLKLF